MKTIKYITFALVLGFMSFNASAQKIGYMNFNTVLQAHPSYDTLTQRLQALENELQLKLVQANDDFEKSYQDLVDYSQRPNMDTAILLSKRSITERLQANLKKDQEEAGKSYERLKADGLKAIIAKIKIAVNEVAKQKGMAYIMDNSTGVLIVKDEAGNITETVMKKMGLAIPINLNE